MVVWMASDYWLRKRDFIRSKIASAKVAMERLYGFRACIKIGRAAEARAGLKFQR